jgi:CRP/FNR family transcriptional regulator
LAALSGAEAESAELKDARGAIVMSTALVTLEPGLLDFRPEIDRGAKSSAGCRLPLPGPGSADKLTGNILSSILSDPSIQLINQIAHFGRQPGHTIIFLEGEKARGVYILYEGRANVLTTTIEGKALILKIALPGDVLGITSVLAGTSYGFTAETIEPCRFAFIAHEDFLKFVKEHSDGCLYFAHHLSRDCHSAYEMIRSMGNPVSKRLARFLISCCANGYVTDGIVRAKLALTHETIAQHIGCSRETVSRTFSDFKRKRIAELVGTTLLVHDRAALESLSAS